MGRFSEIHKSIFGRLTTSSKDTQENHEEASIDIKERNGRDFGDLATSVVKVNQRMGIWKVQREKKKKIYQAYSEYIECLEASLRHITNDSERYDIEQQIKNLKQTQQQFYVPTLLEGSRYDLFKNQEELKDTLENSSFELVKRIGSRIQKN